jgi:hypothetical protein
VWAAVRLIHTLFSFSFIGVASLLLFVCLCLRLKKRNENRETLVMLCVSRSCGGDVRRTASPPPLSALVLFFVRDDNFLHC